MVKRIKLITQFFSFSFFVVRILQEEDQRELHGIRKKFEKSRSEQFQNHDEADVCELSLSLPSHHNHPSFRRSNVSSTSEISEAVSSYSSSNSSQELRELNLDLSIAPCGA